MLQVTLTMLRVKYFFNENLADCLMTSESDKNVLRFKRSIYLNLLLK